MLKIYKPGQGKYTRLYSAFGAALIVLLGCITLYKQLDARVGEWGLSKTAGIWVSTMIPVGIFVILSLLIIWLINKVSVSDFMISAEGEIKKVNWSSRHEIVISTIVVISDNNAFSTDVSRRFGSDTLIPNPPDSSAYLAKLKS